ncbi:MAG: type 4a pilus biogenesis protein PilO [Candidatus Yanofskybacteria bacterium]|nr:type 4a pilus biogenesis protein PilO [Candidatus Yanofskybacteria bacterium]
MNFPLKNILGAVLLAGAMFLFWVLDFGTYQKISTLRGAITLRENSIQEYQTILANIDEMKREYDQRSSDIRKFSAIIPVNKGTAELVSALERIANQTGIQIAEISLGSPTQSIQLPYEILNVSITAQGGYGALVAFLDGIEKNIRLLDVDVTDAIARQDSSTVLDLKIQANAYFIK